MGIKFFAYSGLLNAITSLILGIFVFSTKFKLPISRNFAYFAFSISWWAFFYFLWLSAQQSYLAFIFIRLAMLGAIIIPAVFTDFITYFLEQKKTFVNRINLFLMVIFIIFVFHPAYITKVEPRSIFSFWPVPGFLFHLMFAYFFVNVIYAHLCLWEAVKKSTGLRRNQIKYIFLGTLIGFIGGSTNYFLWYKIPVPPYLNFLVSIYVICIAYAILRYRLMDITVAITRTSVFILVYTVVLGLPFAAAIWFKDALVSYLGPNWWTLPLGLMAVLATAGPFVYIYLERKAEERLLKEQRRYQQTLKQASMGMTRIRNLNKLLNLIAHIVTKTVKISYVAIYLYDKQAEEYFLQLSRDKGRIPVGKVSQDNPLVSWLRAKRDPLIYEEIKQKMLDTPDNNYKLLEENMRLLTASVVIPSFMEDKFMGFFVLGDKMSGQIYTPDDLNVFQVLATQAALAIENAQFYEETKEMQEQISQAEKMATIGTMADGLSHQINNRFYALSLIAGDTIDTIKITDTSKCTLEVREMIGEINHALQRIQTNVVQGGEVVRGMLKYSRRGEDGFDALELNKVLDNTLEMVQFKVKLSEFDIVRDFDHIPKIKGNMTQLEEVFFNFIDNAYDAIVERRDTFQELGYRGKITVSARKKSEQYLEIIVEDNGIGVKDDDNKKLFTPFFTTKTSSRTKGTGLGLYVIKRIITDIHKGRISLESQYKTGTRFILELPSA